MNGSKKSSKNHESQGVIFKIVAQHDEGKTVILQAVAPSIKTIEKHYGISIDNLNLEIKEIDYEQPRIS